MALDAGTAYIDIQPQVGKGFFASLTSKMGGLKAVGLAGGAALAAGLGAGIAAFKIGESFDEAFDTIRVGTGATGEALEGLKDDFKDVFAAVPTDAATAATAIADLNTRTGNTGEGLQTLAKQMLEVSRITGEDLSGGIESATRLFGDWGVVAGDQEATLDKLFVASQATGIGFGQLADMTVQFGAPLRNLGFGMDESIALFAKWNKEGVNTETIFGGLRQAVGRFAKEGRDVPTAFRETIDAIKEAESASDATAIAMEVFGARSGPDLADAVRGGKFELDDLLATIQGSEETILGAAADTESFGEKWQKLVNRTLVALEPIATRVFTAMGEAMDWLAPRIGPFIDAIGKIGSVVMELLAPALEVISSLFSTIFGFFSQATTTGTELPGVWGELWGQVTAIFTDAKVLIESVLEGIRVFWEAHGEAIMATVKRVWETIAKTISGFLDIIRGIIQVVTAIFKGDWSLAWEGIKNIVKGAVKVVTSTVERLWELVKLAFRLGVAAIKLVWTRLWDSLKSLASTAWGKFTGWVEGIWDTFTGWWSDAWGSLGDFVSGAFAGVAGAVKGVLNGVIGALEQGINAALRALNRAIDYADVIAGPFINFPDNPVKPISIPRLHDGGTVALPGLVNMKPGEELVGLPSGASVFPLDRLDGLQGRPINVTMYMDGRVVAKAAGPNLVDDVVLHAGVARL